MISSLRSRQGKEFLAGNAWSIVVVMMQPYREPIVRRRNNHPARLMANGVSSLNSQPLVQVV